MDYRLYIGVYLNAVDISDYVVRISSVPVLSRNEDYSLVAEGYTFQLSTYTIVPVKGQTVVFKRNGTVIHLGFIDKISFEEESRLYSVEVANMLELLKDYRTNDYFTTFMNLYTVTKNINTRDQTVIFHNNLIAAIFNTIGLSLDWSLFALSSYTAKGYTQDGHYTGVFSFVDVPAFTEQDIYYLPNQITCLNQAKVWAPSYLNTEEGNQNRVTLFDLLSLLFSITGYTAIAKSESTFYILSAKTAYTINDDNIKSRNKEELEPQVKGLNSRLNTCLIHAGKFGVPYFFRYDAAQVYYYDIAAIYNGDPIDITTYIYNIGDVQATDSVIQWLDHFMPIILIYNGITATHIYYNTVPIFGPSFPTQFISKAKMVAATRTEMVVDASVILPVTKNRALSIKISDVKNDLIELELYEQ